MLAALGAGSLGTAQSASTIVPDGRTATSVTVNGNTYDVETGTVSGGRGFNSFTDFNLGAGDIGNLRLPNGVGTLVNLVSDSAVEIHGTLNSLLDNGQVGGNVLFADPHGFVVGASGVVNVGSLMVTTPTADFVDDLITGMGTVGDQGGGNFDVTGTDGVITIDGAAIDDLIAGRAPLSEGGITIEGEINAQDAVKLYGDSVTVAGTGAIDVESPDQATADLFFSSVNTDGLRQGSNLEVRDGQVAIVGEGDVTVAGEITAGGDAGADAAKIGIASNSGNVNFEDGTVVAAQGNDTDGGEVAVRAVDQVIVKGAADGTSGALISTRRVADGDDVAEDASTGDSGAIVLDAPDIDVEHGASLRADADSGHAAGDVTLTAHKIVQADPFALRALGDSLEDWGEALAEAAVDIDGDVRGHDVSAEAHAEARVIYDDTTADEDDGFNLSTAALTDLAKEFAGETINDASETNQVLEVGYVSAQADATVDVGATANIEAAGDVELDASAVREAATPATLAGSGFGAALVFGEVAGETRVEIASGADVGAGGDLDLAAHSDNILDVAASTTVDGKRTTPSFATTFAYGQSDVTTEVLVNPGAGIDAGDVTLQARTDNDFSVAATAAMASDGDALGIAAAVTDHETVTVADYGADHAAGTLDDLTVLAQTDTARNHSTATTTTGTGAKKRQNRNASGDATNAVDKSTGRASDKANTASGAGSNGKRIQLGAAITVANSRNTAEARIGEGADINADGDLAVIALNTEQEIRNHALSTVTAKKKNQSGQSTSLSAAVALGFYETAALAEIGDDAIINADRVGVGAETVLPLDFGLPDFDFTIDRWDDFSRIAEDLETAGDAVSDPSQFYTSFADASGKADQVSVAGSVNVHQSRGGARAWIGEGAEVTADAADGAWITELGGETVFDWDAPVDVAAATDVLSLHGSGDIYALIKTLVRNRKQGESVLGGAFNWIDYGHDTVAGIGDGADVTADRVRVDADAEHMVITVTPSAGKGTSLAGLGMVAVTALDNVTHASVSSGADLTADDIVLDAEQDLSLWTVAGAITRSESKGVGLAVAVNDVDTDTRAYVGDNEDDNPNRDPDDPSDHSGGEFLVNNLRINARTEGQAGALAVAGAEASAGTGSDSAGGGSTNNDTPSFVDQTKTNAQNNTDDGKTKAQDQTSADNSTLNKNNDTLRQQNNEEPGQTGGQKQKNQMGLAVSGAGSANVSDMATVAELDGVTVSGRNSVDVDAEVTAVTQTDLIAASGAGALVRAKNSSSGFKAGVAGAVAFNDGANVTRAAVDDAVLNDLDALDVQAMTAGDALSIGLGIAVNSAQSSKSASLAGSFSISHFENATDAEIEDSTLTGTGAGSNVDVVAYDRSRIATGGGAFYKGGKTGIGFAGTYAGITNDVEARLAGSTLTDIGSLDVAALTASRMLGMAVMGGGSAQANSNGIAGAFVINDIENTVRAAVEDGSDVTTTDAVNLTASGTDGQATLDDLYNDAGGQGEEIDFAAEDASTVSISEEGSGDDRELVVGDEEAGATGAAIIGAAGVIQASKGGNNLGLSYAGNFIDNDFTAEIVDSDVNAGGDLNLSAVDNAQIIGVSVGGGINSGKFAGVGSVTTNVINNSARAAVAGVEGEDGDPDELADIDAASLSLTADETADIYALAGNVTASKKAAVGASVGVNVITNEARAEANFADVDLDDGAAVLDADNDSTIYGVAVSGAATSGSVAVAGSLNINVIDSTVASAIEGGELDAGSLTVDAYDESDIYALAGGFAGSKGTAVGLGIGVNVIGTSVAAEVLDSTLTVDDATRIESDSDAGILSLAAAGAAGGKAAVAGSVGVNVIGAQDAEEREEFASDSDVSGAGVRASLTDSTLNGGLDDPNDPATILPAGNLTVSASDNSEIDTLAGAVSGAGKVGVGAALSGNYIGSTTAAEIAGSSVDASDITVAADNRASIDSIAAAIGGGGKVAVYGSLTTNIIESDLVARVGDADFEDGDDKTDIEANSLNVEVNDDADIRSLAGSVSGGGKAQVGAALSVNVIEGGADAELLDSTLDIDGAVDVDAISTADILSAAASAGGGGNAAVNGSATVNVIDSTLDAKVSGVEQIERGTDFSVTADNDATIHSLAGAVSGAGSAGIGVAAAVNVIGGRTEARLEDSELDAAGDVTVDGSAGSDIKSAAVSAGGGGTAAVNGSFTVNTVTRETLATADGVTQTDSSENFTVAALDESTILSLAGSVGGAGTAAVGGAVSVNVVGGKTGAKVTGSDLDVTDTLSVTAESKGAERAIPLDFESGGGTENRTVKIRSAAVSGGGAGTAAVNGSATVNVVTADVTAEIEDTTQSGPADTVEVRATDDSAIESLAGAVGGAGAAAVGASASVNFIGLDAGDDAVSLDEAGLETGEGPDDINDLENDIQPESGAARSVRAEIRGSDLDANNEVRVESISTAKIDSLSGAGGAAGGAAVNGAATANNIGTRIQAGIVDTELDDTGTDVFVDAEDDADIRSIALALSGGGVAVGGAAAVNRIETDLDAYVLGGANGHQLHARNVVLDAFSTSDIRTIGVGGAVGGTGVAGSVAVNLIDTDTAARIGEDADGNGADVIAEHNVGVLADSRDTVEVVAGAVGIGGGGGGLGASAVVNKIDSQATAGITGENTRVSALGKGTGLEVWDSGLASGRDLNAVETAAESTPDEDDYNDDGTAKNGSSFEVDNSASQQLRDALFTGFDRQKKTVNGVAVNAASTQQSATLAVSIGGDASLAGAGTAVVDVQGGETRAAIEGADVNQHSGLTPNANQQVDVLASSHGFSGSLVASGAFSGGGAVAGSLATPVMDRRTEAVVDGAEVGAESDVDVEAESTLAAAAFSAGAAAALVGGAGSGVLAILDNETRAAIEGGAVIDADNIRVEARGSNQLKAFAGALGAGAVGLSGSASIAVLGSDTEAQIKDSEVNPGGDLLIRADSDTDADNTVVAAGAGLAGVAANAAVTVVESDTSARLDNSTVGADDNKAGLVTIQADDSLDLDHIAGAGAAGGAGVGVAANVLVGQGRVEAVSNNSDVYADGALEVDATRTAELDADTVAASLGGASISGAVGVMVLGSAPSGSLDGDLGDTLGAMGETGQSDKVNEDSVGGNEDADLDDINDRTRYDVEGNVGAGSEHATVARVEGGTIRTGSVDIDALDRIGTENVAGGVGVGGVAVGAAVAITEVHSTVNAGLLNADVVTGNLDVTSKVESISGDAVDVEAIAAGGGVVSLGVGYAEGGLSNTISATLGGDVTADDIDVEARDDAAVNVEGLNAQVGAAAVGAMVSQAHKNSSVTAGIASGADIDSTSLDLDAFSGGGLTAESTAAAGGILGSGNGSAATAEEESVVRALIGDGAEIDTFNGFNVAARARPDAVADAWGVSVAGGVGVGASVAQAEAAPNVEASTGNNVTVTGGDFDLTAESLPGSGEYAADAYAETTAGGVLAGVNATVATANGVATVQATTGDNLNLPDGNTTINAYNRLGQSAVTEGKAFGIAAVGANVSKAAGKQTTVARLGDNAQASGDRAGDVTVTATGDDHNNAVSNSGAGGVVAGSAAFSQTDSVSNTHASIGGNHTGDGELRAGDVQVEADQRTEFNSMVDSTRGGLATGSGAVTDDDIDATVKAFVGDDADLDTTAFRLAAANSVTRPDNGYNSRTRGGGFIDGGAGVVDADVAMDTDAEIGDGAVIATRGEGDIEIEAVNDIAATVRTRLDTGGAVAIALAEAYLDVYMDADVVVGGGAEITSMRDLRIGARSSGNITAAANTKTYGAAGAARGKARARLDTAQNVVVGSGAELYSNRDSFITAGRDANGSQNSLRSLASVDLWNKTAIPVETDPKADSYVVSDNRVDIQGGTLVEGGRNIDVVSTPGSISSTGRGRGKDLYRKVLEDIGEFFCGIFGCDPPTLDIKYDNNSASSTNNVTVGNEAMVRAGVSSLQEITINTVGDDGDIGVVEHSKGVRFEQGTIDLEAFFNEQIAEYEQLRAETDDSDLKQAYSNEIDILQRQIEKLGDHTVNDLIELEDITAQPGRLRVNGNLSGSGTLAGGAAPEVNIRNESAAVLRVNDIEVKGGDTGIFVNSVPQFGGSVGGVTIEAPASTGDPSVLIEGTFNDNQQGYEGPPSDLFLDGDIHNPQGSVDVSTQSGSIYTAGKIKADSISITSGGDLIISYTPGFTHVAGTPPDADGAGLLARGEVFLSGQYVDINGLVQSGVADWEAILPADLSDQIDDARDDYLTDLVAAGGDDSDVKKLYRLNGFDNPGQNIREGVIIANYNAEKNRIELSNVGESAGYVRVFGHVLSTGNGEIKALSGFTHVTVDNDLSLDLVVGGINTGDGVNGQVEIIDAAYAEDINFEGETLENVYRTRIYEHDWQTDTITVSEGRRHPDNFEFIAPLQEIDSIDGRVAGDYQPTGEVDLEFEIFGSAYTYKVDFDNVFENGGDNPIGIEFIGHDIGDVDIDSAGNVLLDGGIQNLSGETAIDSGGAIRQTSELAYVQGGDGIDLRATSGIGNADRSIDVRTGDSGTVDAVTDRGTVALHADDGDLRLERAHTGGDNVLSINFPGIPAFGIPGFSYELAQRDGDVALSAVGEIEGMDLGGGANVIGDEVTLDAGRGISGVADGALAIESGFNHADAPADGALEAVANEDIDILQTAGDLELRTVVSRTGDVHLTAQDGAIVNARAPQTDVRTEEELVELWNENQLLGNGAEASADATVVNFESTVEQQYFEYWQYRQYADADGKIELEAEEVDFLKPRAAADLGTANPNPDQVTEYAQRRYNWLTQYFIELDAGTPVSELPSFYAVQENGDVALFDGTPDFGAVDGLGADFQALNEGFDYTVAENTAEDSLYRQLTDGAEWTEDELLTLINRDAVDVFIGTTDTQTEVLNPNVEGENVTLEAANGNIGSLRDPVFIDFTDDAAELTDAQKAALAGAQPGDLTEVRNADDEVIGVEILQTRSVNVEGFNDGDTANVTARADEIAGRLFLGSEQALALQEIRAGGDIRIATRLDLISADPTATVIFGGADGLELESAEGTIGALDAPVRMNLTTDADEDEGEVIARAQGDIALTEVDGDLLIANLFSESGDARLTAENGGIDSVFVSQTPRQVDISTGSLELSASGGIGRLDNPIEIALRANESLSADAGGDIYILSPLNDVLVDRIESDGANVDLRTAGFLLGGETNDAHILAPDALTVLEADFDIGAEDLPLALDVAEFDAVSNAGDIWLKILSDSDSDLITAHNGLVWIDADAGLDLGRVESGDYQEIDAAGDLNFDTLDSGDYALLKSGGDMTGGDIITATDLMIDAEGALVLDSGISGGAQTLFAQSAEIGTLDAVEFMQIHTLGDLTAGVLESDTALLGEAGFDFSTGDPVGPAWIRVMQAAAPEVVFRSTAGLEIDDAQIGESIGLFSQDITASITHTGPNPPPLLLSLTGSVKKVADRADLFIDAQSFEFDRLYVHTLDIDTTAPRFVIADGFIPGVMNVRTPFVHILMDNIAPAAQAADMQLYEPDFQFFLEQEFVQTYTDSFVVQRAPNFRVRVPNFNSDHENQALEYDGSSAAKHTVRHSQLQRLFDEIVGEEDRSGVGTSDDDPVKGSGDGPAVNLDPSDGEEV